MDEEQLADHTSALNDLIEEAQNHINKIIQESYVAPKNAMEHWAAFSSAIDWSERWIQCLLLFHVIVFLAVIISRKNIDIQTGLFCFIAMLVFLSEHLNSFAAVHWKEFSRQNYFDKHGVFTGTLFSGPLLVICLLQLINFLGFAASFLITFKKLEHKKRSQQTSREGQEVKNKKIK